MKERIMPIMLIILAILLPNLYYISIQPKEVTVDITYLEHLGYETRHGEKSLSFTRFLNNKAEARTVAIEIYNNRKK